MMLTTIYLYVLIGAALLLGTSWFLVPYVVRRVQARRLARLCRQLGVLVLSFDDGPSDSLTPRVADLLQRLGIKASFFFIGERALQHPHIVKRITDDGHEMGTHSARHLNAWKSLPVAHCRDMLDGHRQISGLVGQTSLFRPPYGKMSLASFLLAWIKRLSLAWWTIDARDTLARPRSHGDVLNLIAAAGGGIVLLHDHDRLPDSYHDRYVLDLIEKIAALASEKGLRFVTFSELSELASASAGASMRHSAVRP